MKRNDTIEEVCAHLLGLTLHGEKIPLCKNPDDCKDKSDKVFSHDRCYADGCNYCKNKRYVVIKYK